MKETLSRWRIPAAAVLLWLAAAGSLMLAWRVTQQGSLPGCADGAGCGSVLSSAYGRILGIPAGWWGLAVYSLLNLTGGAWVRREATGAAVIGAVLAGMAAGGAFWFIFVQAVLLHQWCLWCLAVHLAALSAVILLSLEHRRTQPVTGARSAGRFVLAGLVVTSGGLGLMGWQNTRPAASASPVAALTHVPSPGPPLLPNSWEMHLGTTVLPLDLNLLPVTGPSHEARTVVLLTDYTCPHCRSYGPVVEALAASQTPPLRLVLLPASRDDAGAAVQRTLLTAYQTDQASWRVLHGRLISGALEANPAVVADAARTLFGNEVWSRSCQIHGASVDAILNAGRVVQLTNRARFPDAMLPQLMAGDAVLMGAEQDSGVIADFLSKAGITPATPVVKPAPPGPEVLTLLNPELSLGAPVPGSTARVVLKIMNRSRSASSLQQAELDAGCLIVSLSGAPIAAGSTREVVIDCQIPDAAGPFERHIVFNTPGAPLRARLTGTVTPRDSIARSDATAPLPITAPPP